MESIQSHEMGDDCDEGDEDEMIMKHYHPYSTVQNHYTSASIQFNVKSHKLFIKAVYPFRASEKQKVSVFVWTFSNLNQLTLGALGDSHASSTKCQWGQLLLTSKT